MCARACWCRGAVLRCCLRWVAATGGVEVGPDRHCPLQTTETHVCREQRSFCPWQQGPVHGPATTTRHVACFGRLMFTAGHPAPAACSVVQACWSSYMTRALRLCRCYSEGAQQRPCRNKRRRFRCFHRFYRCSCLRWLPSSGS